MFGRKKKQRDAAPGICGLRTRAPDSISCFWKCERARGHDGMHAAILQDGQHVMVRLFTTDEARQSWLTSPYFDGGADAH